MWILILGIIVFTIFVYCKQNHLHIRWFTFFKKGIRVSRGRWGVTVFNGKQGQGKTTAIIEYLKDNKNLEIFCNIKGIRGLDYFYYDGLQQLMEIKKFLDGRKERNDKQIVIVYDEIFTQLDKHTRLNKNVIDFLCQMRKRKIIFLTSCQAWGELPLSFRRFCRYEVDCYLHNIFGLSILRRVYRDAENMIWNNDIQDFEAPILETTISKYRKSIAESFDTYYIIHSDDSPKGGVTTTPPIGDV